MDGEGSCASAGGIGGTDADEEVGVWVDGGYDLGITAGRARVAKTVGIESVSRIAISFVVEGQDGIETSSRAAERHFHGFRADILPGEPNIVEEGFTAVGIDCGRDGRGCGGAGVEVEDAGAGDEGNRTTGFAFV